MTNKETLLGRQIVRSFTRRQRQVAGLIAIGKSFAEIARMMGITEQVAKNYAGSVYKKAGVSGRLEFIILCFENGMVRYPAPPKGKAA